MALKNYLLTQNESLDLDSISEEIFEVSLEVVLKYRLRVRGPQGSGNTLLRKGWD